MIDKIDWHPAELFFHLGSVATNLPMDPDRVVRFYNRMLKTPSCGLR